MSERPVLFVGDVQGCADELRDLLRAAAFDGSRHRLALCGDLINRGPDSAGVLDLARRLDAQVVVGNHELSLLAGRRTAGLDQVRAQLGSSLDEWLGWLGGLPTFLRDDGYILVHAGIVPGKRPEQCTPAELTEIRMVEGRPWFDSWRGPETVIFGHWAQRGKVDLALCKGLDTGCVYGGQLTGLWWPRREWVSVEARRRWYERGTAD
ncbi:MAG TPA: metallophosphoesterase [Candidatus Methylomirabilis sp.]|nr:metallophosphoesterase [Candidatus Methylomirabilis sp.]